MVAGKTPWTGEPLPPTWRCAGTTGYDALNLITGLFVDPAGEQPLTSLWQSLTDDQDTYEEVVEAAKGSTSVHKAGFVSAVLFVVPGFALVTAALDLAKLDFSAGVSRTVYALMILTASAISVWAVSVAAGLTVGSLPPMDLAPAVRIALRALASAGGVLGFALMFNTPWKMALTASGIGMVGNVARLEMSDRGVVVQAATTISCVLIGFLAAWAAPRLASPHIPLAVPAVRA